MNQVKKARLSMKLLWKFAFAFLENSDEKGKYTAGSTIYDFMEFLDEQQTPHASQPLSKRPRNAKGAQE